jgi:hypothetical protein
MTTIEPPSEQGGQQWPAPRPGSDPVPPAPPRGPRPRSVEISFWLWVGYLALSALGVLGAFTQLDQIRAEMIKVITENPSLDPAVIDRLTTGFFVGVLVVMVVFIVVAFTLALLMRAGRNGARIALAVLGALALLLWLLGLAGSGGSVLRAGLLQLLLLVAAMATMFGSAANSWFRPRNPQL